MHTTFSTTVWALLVAAAVARFLLLNTRPADRTLNAGLFWILLSCLLRSPTTQVTISSWTAGSVSADAVMQLGESVTVLAAAAIFLTAFYWSDAKEPKHLQLTVFIASASAATATFILCMYARASNTAMQGAPGWEAVAYSYHPGVTLAVMAIHDTPIYFFAGSVIFICIVELRRRPPLRVIAVCSALLIMAVGSLIQSVAIAVASLLAMQGQHHQFIDVLGTVSPYTATAYAYILGVVAAVPLFCLALERLGLDKFSLLHRRLMPIWRDLTTACPEIAQLHHPEHVHRRPRYALHRTVVEIRDSILILSRYATEADETLVQQLTDAPTDLLALRLALAWHAKTGGQSPTGDVAAQRSAATDLLEETHELVELSLQWELAKTVVACLPHATRTTVAR
ncbi:MAG: DUF6545 domain-containing protein [Mycobacterium sp.]